MKIILDLDGTLLDSKERLYRLFQSLVKESEFSFEQYWARKRNKMAHKQILKEEFSFSDSDIEEFEEKWMRQIELPEWLQLDKPFQGVTEYLKNLRKNHQLYLVTARQSETGARGQLEKYGWLELFDKVLVTRQREEKYDLLKKQVNTSKEDWMVGDTGYDILVGKKLGINTAAVLSGFLNRVKLEEYHPDIIVEDITKLKI